MITVKPHFNSKAPRTGDFGDLASALLTGGASNARDFAAGIVDAVREPLLVLDGHLRVIAANRSFYQAFRVIPDETIGRRLYSLGNEQWNIPRLRELLEAILPKDSSVEAFEVELDFPEIGCRLLCLNARRIYRGEEKTETILLAMEDVTERKLAEKQVTAARRYTENILETIREPFLVLDKELHVVSGNRSFYSTFQVKPEETEKKLVYDLGNKQWDIPALRRLLAEVIPQNNEVCDFEVVHDFPLIGHKVMLLNARAVHEESGERQLILLAIEDISTRRRAEKAFFREKERAEVTLKSIGDAVITTDADGVVEYVNPVAETLIGWTLDEARGQRLDNVFHIVDERSRQRVPNPVARCLAQGRVVGLGNHTTLISRDGREYSIMDSAAPIRDRDNEILGVVLVFSDVTAARRMSLELTHQATHDALTGLVNRAEFERRLLRVLETARAAGAVHALCYLDLDQFKVINDTCGHVAGDELLRQVGGLLQGRVRDRDTLARLGGDEFGVLMEHCSLKQAERLANALRDAIEELRFVWEDKRFNVGVSIGLVPITEASERITGVLSAADAACYAAKEKGRNRIHIYRAGDAELATRRGEMQWVGGIQRALEQGRFHLVGQAIAPINGNETAGAHYEILLRMTDEEGGIVRPGAFLPAAERYDLATKIDRWVIHNAFEWLAHHREHLELLHLCEINLSGQSLGDEPFLEMAVCELKEANIPPGKICFEVTETAAIANLTGATHFIQTLMDMGCRFALDDFGSGLSSFAYLKNLPVDFLKIDGAFVRNIAADPIDLAMVKSISEIARAMGKRTIAEFVETADILEELKRPEIGVDYVQGFHIGRPRPLDEMR